MSLPGTTGNNKLPMFARTRLCIFTLLVSPKLLFIPPCCSRLCFWPFEEIDQAEIDDDNPVHLVDPSHEVQFPEGTKVGNKAC